MNTGMSLNNYKKRVRRNWDLNKDRYDIFETDASNVNVIKNDRLILNFDYDNNNV